MDGGMQSLTICLRCSHHLTRHDRSIRYEHRAKALGDLHGPARRQAGERRDVLSRMMESRLGDGEFGREWHDLASRSVRQLQSYLECNVRSCGDLKMPAQERFSQSSLGWRGTGTSSVRIAVEVHPRYTRRLFSCPADKDVVDGDVYLRGEGDSA